MASKIPSRVRSHSLSETSSRSVKLCRRASQNVSSADLVSQLCALSLKETTVIDIPGLYELKDILKGNNAPLHLWNTVALHCWVRGRAQAFCGILEDALISANTDYSAATGDQKLCFNLLSYYYIGVMLENYGSEDEKDTLSRLINLMSDTTTAFQEDNDHYPLIRGLCFMIQNRNNVLPEPYVGQDVVSFKPYSHFPLLCQGVCLFQQEKFVESLECFQKILRVSACSCGSAIRMVIGHCYFQLQKYEKAKLAYSRALQIDPDCIGALVGLSYVHLYEEDDLGLEKARELVSKAYKLDSKNILVRNILCDTSDEPDLLPSLLAMLREVISSDVFEAQLVNAAANCHHEIHQYEEAFQYYSLAAQFGKDIYLAPQFGLGQIYIRRKNFGSAVDCFERIIKVFPDDVDTMRTLAFLYHDGRMEGKQGTTKRYLEMVSAMFPDDFDVLMVLGGIYDVTDRNLALQTYFKAYDICQRNKTELPVELCNNISALYCLLADYEESLRFLLLAKERLEKDSVNHNLHLSTTIRYNEARLNEALNNLDFATSLYEFLLILDSTRVDCYLRLGCIALQQGIFDEAREWLEIAASMDPDNAEPRIHLVRLYELQTNYLCMEEQFEATLKNPESRNDTYALLEFGNFCLTCIHRDDMPACKRKQYAEKAFALYRQVLQLDPKNVYAANGLASVLSKTGFASTAQNIFQLIVDDCPNVCDFWMNYGHCQFEQKQYEAALESYDKAVTLSMKNVPDSNLLLCLSHALVLRRDWKKLLKTMQVALRFYPENHLVRYNFSVVNKRHAVVVLRSSLSTCDEVVEAIENLKLAQRSFGLLLSDSIIPLGMDKSKIQRAVESCKDYLNQSTNQLMRSKRVDSLDSQSSGKRVAWSTLLSSNRLRPATFRDICDSHNEPEKIPKKREAVDQRTDNVKDKFVRHEEKTEAAKKRTVGFAQLDDPSSEEVEAPRKISTPSEAEPVRKRAKAISVLLRRQRRVAERKRRELEIEQNTVSSDEENAPHYNRFPRRKSGRHDAHRERCLLSTKHPVCDSIVSPIGEMLPPCSRSDSMAIQPVELQPSVRSSTEEDMSSPPNASSSKPITSETASDEGPRKKGPMHILRSQMLNFTSRPPALFTSSNDADKRRTVLTVDSDDGAKRLISDYEEESRKRQSTT